jgi:lactate dehydrogenase-like 2-hydroxyacid dehydrogenase
MAGLELGQSHEGPIVVLVTEPVIEPALDWMRERGAEFLLMYEGDDWQSRASEICAIIVRAFRVDVAVLDSLPALEVVVKHGVGVNTIDLDETTRRGILVTNVPGANMNAVAEHSVALLAALSRDLVDADKLLRSGRFSERFGMRTIKELTDTRLGIVGGGRIGRRIAAITHGGYGCEIAVFDPHLPDVAVLEPFGGTLIGDVGELFDWADNVVIAAPLTPDTRGLVDAAMLARLGADGSIVCASRGGIIDEAALAAAVRDGMIRGAALDVWEPEPPAPDNPLFALPGTVLTPHIAFASDKSMERMGMDSVTQLWALLHGEPAPIVTPESWG